MASSILLTPLLNSFGFHLKSSYRPNETCVATRLNARIFLGYIVILGTIIGINQIIRGAKLLKKVSIESDPDTKQFLKMHAISLIVRGILNLPSCGVLLLPIDLVIYGLRVAIYSYKYNSIEKTQITMNAIEEEEDGFLYHR